MSDVPDSGSQGIWETNSGGSDGKEDWVPWAAKAVVPRVSQCIISSISGGALCSATVEVTPQQNYSEAGFFFPFS